MTLHHIFTYLKVTLSIQVSYLIILIFLFNRIFKRRIEEVSLGVDNLFLVYIKNVKVKIGLTFFFAVGLKPRKHENVDIRNKEFKLFSILNIVVKLFQLIFVFIMGGMRIISMLYYIFYFCYIINLQQLKIGLHHLNGFNLAAGILELAVICDIMSEVIIRFISEGKIKQTIYLLNGGVAMLLYIRLVCGYIFNL